MKITSSYYLFLILLCLCANPAQGQGKLLRGEKWEKFSEAGKSADFYVAPNGNDQWSGTLAEPNSTNTDGPFASISRAQEAVRLLKSQVYIPKGKPVETRWIG